MKFIDKLIRVLLVGMILLSLYLSAKIWTNSGSQSRKSRHGKYRDLKASQRRFFTSQINLS